MSMAIAFPMSAPSPPMIVSPSSVAPALSSLATKTSPPVTPVAQFATEDFKKHAVGTGVNDAVPIVPVIYALPLLSTAIAFAVTVDAALK